MHETSSNMDHKYDYLILGSGNSALTVGALLANAGYKVCMLEAHDIPGGYAQSFKWGDFYFCGQVHYIWGCGPGGRIYEFLKKIGLHEDITFELYDPKGYDRISLPDGKIISIPYGFERLIENIEVAYPGQRANLQKFFRIIRKIRAELRTLPERRYRWWEYITKGWQYTSLILYRNKTLQNVFDECNLGKEAQAVLAGDAGDFMLPPNELSILAYVGLFCGYNTGAYYPTKHYKYYFERVAQFIGQKPGCHVFYETEVVKINVEGDRVTSVETKNGRTFSAKTIICNIDPKRAAELIGVEKFPAEYRKKLSYRYSESSMMIYLGLKGIDLEAAGLGRFNLWHLGQWDLNAIWETQRRDDFRDPWLFISTPTLHSQYPGTRPAGSEIMNIATSTDYGQWKALRDRDYKAYDARKNEVADRMLDIVEQKYLPGLRQHIVTKVIGSPTSNAEWVWAPFGNAYGQPMTPKEVGPGRFRQETPFSNFYFCNATAGYASIYGTTGNGITLYTKLTGDTVFEGSKSPTDEEFVAAVSRQ